MDDFGDGWDTSLYTKFMYWIEVRGQMTNMVTETLNCGCPMKVGCWKPSSVNVDQMYHLTVQAYDSAGKVVDPGYEWEVQWTAQIVEAGVWKRKYYGGYNTSMVFQYARASTSYSLVWWENLWKYTETCAESNCDSSSRVSSYLSVRDFVTRISSSDTSVSPTFSYGKSAVSSFLTTSWYITDRATNKNLYAYNNPFCDGTSGSLNTCDTCLTDGSYIYRATGICDTSTAVSWSFCGRTGTSKQQLKFSIVGSVCYPETVVNVAGVCSGTESPTFTPTHIPIVSRRLEDERIEDINAHHNIESEESRNLVLNDYEQVEIFDDHSEEKQRVGRSDPLSVSSAWFVFAVVLMVVSLIGYISHKVQRKADQPSNGFKKSSSSSLLPQSVFELQ